MSRILAVAEEGPCGNGKETAIPPDGHREREQLGVALLNLSSRARLSAVRGDPGLLARCNLLFKTREGVSPSPFPKSSIGNPDIFVLKQFRFLIETFRNDGYGGLSPPCCL